jgi:serine protease Do
VQASVVEIRTRGGGAGAGTIWRRDGVIVTNYHVVPRDRAEVTLATGQTLAGTVTARDRHNDLAVVAVEAHDLPAVAIGDARALRPGELVLAIGHPFGVRSALTIGVVHEAAPSGGLRFGPDSRRDLVQADVLLGPGNSGGPLTDARGTVVGINAMVHGGLALAVPSHLAERLVESPEGPPRLGVGVREVTLPPLQAALASQAGASAESAVLVLEVEPDGAAARAGVHLGDILLAIDGHPLADLPSLPEALAAQHDGEARLTLLRGTDVIATTAQPRRRGSVTRSN